MHTTSHLTYQELANGKFVWKAFCYFCFVLRDIRAKFLILVFS